MYQQFSFKYAFPFCVDDIISCNFPVQIWMVMTTMVVSITLNFSIFNLFYYNYGCSIARLFTIYMPLLILISKTMINIMFLYIQ